ncbi:MAG TPA: methyltransferase domain-containing protein [Anaerolineales bacterium]|nr:methyltransferase domain-containing protein [Anaerolineales bacterium]
MKPDILALVCDPTTRDALEYRTESDAHSTCELLVNVKTGKRFPIRENIPIFIEQVDVSGSNKRYQSMYDRFAPFYDFSTWAYSRWKGMDVETRLREYLDELEIKEGDRVLEVSVGTGRNLQFLPHTACYYGLDLSWGMLKQCQRNTAKWKLNTTLFMGNAECLPFKDESFDVVFHFGGINFFNDRETAIREMIRVAKPGTKFIIGDENEELAQKYEKLPVTGDFYGHRPRAISAPIDLLPAEMQDVHLKDIAGGDLYCLSFRKP